MRMNNRAKLILVLAAVAGALGFVGYQVFRATGGRTFAPDATFTEGARLAEFAADGVRIVVFKESDAQGQPLLRATFTPTEPGFHLYSKDLNLKKTDGIGVPTRLELLPNSTIRVNGKPFTDVGHQSHKVAPLHITVDIYPDGPVTLRLPIEFVGAATSATAQVAVSYMACKTDGLCLPPVERRIVDVQIPR
jgi:hypothetical protein